MNVLIVQLFPRQFEWLNRAYDGPHELDFLDSAKEESVTRLKAKADRADKVVVLTKFISHSHWDVIPRDKVIHSDSVNLDRLLHILDTLPPDVEQPRAANDEPKLVAPKVHVTKRFPMSTTTTREVDGFVLTTAVPPPGIRPKTQYPFEAMRVGESFFVTCEESKRGQVAANISAAMNYYTKKYAPTHVFKTSVKEGGGVRCWRMPDRAEAREATKKTKKK